MRVVCDNCGSVYKIPDDKLVKPVNKATCRSCGYRMLIPRPTGNEEERTLVTNNPMTPAGAVPRAGGPHTSPLSAAVGDDEPEHTMPVKLKSRAAATPRPSPGRRVAGVPSAHSISYDDYPEVPLLPGTPMPQERGAAPPRPRGPHVPTPPEEKTSWVRNPTGGVIRPPEPLSRDSEQPTRINARLTPEPAPSRDPQRDTHRDNHRDPEPARRDDPPRRDPLAIDPSSQRDPAPAPRPSPSSEPNYPPVGPRPTSPGLMYDPSADLNLALLGLFAALFGLVIFAVDFRFDNWMLQTLIRSIALLMSFGGVFTSLFVILTSSRGRRPASQLMSLLVAGVLATIALSFSLGVEGLRGWSQSPDAPPANTGAPATASLPDLTAPPEGQDPSEPAVADADASKNGPASARKPASNGSNGSSASAPPSRSPSSASPPPSAPIRVPVPSNSGSSSGGSSSSSYNPPSSYTPPPAYEPPPPRVSSPPPSSPPASGGAMDTVPMEVIDVMLRNNIDVKKCFFAHLQKAGALPPRVDVRFTLENSGKVSALDVKQPDLQGSDLERCLGTAIRGIQFPPTSGAAAKITFPFIF